MRNNLTPTTPAIDANTPRPLLRLPAPLERKIAAQWREWEAWVLIGLKRPDYSVEVQSAELARLRKRHTEQMLALMRVGMPMRLVRRHRLDDPKISDEAHAVLVRRAMAQRRPRAWFCNLARSER